MTFSRDVALHVLVRVEQGDAFAAPILNREANRLQNPRDAALATELVFGVLRARPHLDRLLDNVATRGLGRIDPVTSQILRIGAYQIAFLKRIPHRAAVSEATGQAQRLGVPGLKPLVNALLRKLARKDDSELKPKEVTVNTPLKEAAIHLGTPPWLLSQLVGDHGLPNALAFMRAFNGPPSRTLRINTNRLSLEQALEILGPQATKGAFSALAVQTSAPDTARKLVDEGLAIYQDEGAQLATLALDAQRDDKILDACAGRGGKTSTLAVLTEGEAEIVATDKSESKLQRLAFELEQQDLAARATTLTWDMTDVSDFPNKSFDRILVDAPCSGSGTMGRRPEIRWRLNPEKVRSLADIQRKILDRLSVLLIPGGRLVYVVCSLFNEEGRSQLEGFLKRHPDFSAVSLPPPGWPALIPWNNGMIMINPAETGSDGYQIFCLEKSRHT